MDLGLKDKIIIVTNGPKGIGESILKVLAAEGAVPVIIGKDESDNLRIVNDIIDKSRKCFQIVADLTKPEACESSIQKIINEFGAINGLINNAEVNDDVGLEHGNNEAFISSLHKNLIHYYLLAHYALPALKKSKGSIINISHKAAYNVAAGAKNALTREWAVELLNYGIRVNAVIVAESCITTTEEIANTVAFLLSEKSSHTTGQLIYVNGG